MVKSYSQLSTGESPLRVANVKKPRDSAVSKRRGLSSAASRTLRESPVAGEVFPPLSTSLGSFLKGGSDREFRDLIYGILSVSTLMLRARERFAEYIGVTAPQYSMMVVIAEAGKATTGQVAGALHVSSSFVTAEIGKLVRRGIIAKTPNEADRRSALLALTPHGRELIVKLGAFRRLGNDMIFGSLTTAQARQLEELVRVLLADAERALHALDAPEWSPERNRDDRRAAAGRSIGRLRRR